VSLPGLKEILDRNNLKAKDLESVTGKRERTIYEYLSGDTTPPLPVLLKIADHFGVSIDYLVGRKDRKEEGKIETNHDDA
jgi:transcriptional regulator with XRE-family HTH domain